MHASGSGYSIICDYLLQYGANVDSCSAEGMTALHFASTNGDLQVTQQIIEAGKFRVQILPHIIWLDMQSPVCFGCRSGDASEVNTRARLRKSRVWTRQTESRDPFEQSILRKVGVFRPSRAFSRALVVYPILHPRDPMECLRKSFGIQGTTPVENSQLSEDAFMLPSLVK